MKRSVILRLFSVLLVLLMISASIVACKPTEGPAGESTPDESGFGTPPPELIDPVADAIIADGGKSDYKIVRGELATEYEKNATSDVVNFFKDNCGLTLSVSDDWVNEALGYKESECEILIGKTNREESVAVYDNLRVEDYAVTIVNKKIVIAAHTEEKLAEAVAYFTEKVEAGEGSAKLGAIDCKYEKGTYGISHITVNGTPLSKYKIVYKTGTVAEIKAAAELLAVELRETYGYVLSTSTDAAAEIEYEIVIGGTNRGNSAELASGLNSFDYSVTVSGNRIFILPGANQAMPEKAVTVFLEELAVLASGGKIEITADNLNKVFKESYPTGNITLNGTPISEYTIVYKNNDPVTVKLANRLRDEIDKTCGRRLTVASDSQSYRNNKEILIGLSKRTDATGPAAGISSKVSSAKNGELFMYSEGDFFFVGGKDYVGTMAAVNRLIAAITDVKDTASHAVSFDVKTATASVQTKYKVITYNDGDNSTTRLQQVASIIKDYAPDIVGMQEVQKMHAPMYETNLKGYKAVYYDHDTNQYGAPILYKTAKFDLVESGTQWLSATPDKKFTKFDESDYIRSYVYAILKDKTTGEEIVVVNTHVDYVDAANRKQIAVLLECTERFRGRPIIYTGDFNMQNTSNGYSQMILSGLRDCGSYLGHSIKGHIDFCFVDVAYVVATNFKYIDDHEFSETASDHCPVYSEIVLAS